MSASEFLAQIPVGKIQMFVLSEAVNEESVIAFVHSAHIYRNNIAVRLSAYEEHDSRHDENRNEHNGHGGEHAHREHVVSSSEELPDYRIDQNLCYCRYQQAEKQHLSEEENLE